MVQKKVSATEANEYLSIKIFHKQNWLKHLFRRATDREHASSNFALPCLAIMLCCVFPPKPSELSEHFFLCLSTAGFLPLTRRFIPHVEYRSTRI